MRRPIATFCGSAQFHRSLAFFCDDIDDAADGLGSVERAAGAPEDFDTIYIVGRQMGEIKSAQSRAVDLHAVNEDQHLI